MHDVVEQLCEEQLVPAHAGAHTAHNKGSTVKLLLSWRGEWNAAAAYADPTTAAWIVIGKKTTKKQKAQICTQHEGEGRGGAPSSERDEAAQGQHAYLGEHARATGSRACLAGRTFPQ